MWYNVIGTWLVKCWIEWGFHVTAGVIFLIKNRDLYQLTNNGPSSKNFWLNLWIFLDQALQKKCYRIKLINSNLFEIWSEFLSGKYFSNFSTRLNGGKLWSLICIFLSLSSSTQKSCLLWMKYIFLHIEKLHQNLQRKTCFQHAGLSFEEDIENVSIMLEKCHPVWFPVPNSFLILLHSINWSYFPFHLFQQCTMCILGTMFSFQPNKLRHVLKVASW